jgi:hypothetical protein
MYVRGNSYYADARDAQGNRVRKSFKSAAAALKYENSLRIDEVTESKKARVKSQLPTALTPSHNQARAKVTRTVRGSRAISSPSVANKPPKKSIRLMSKKSSPQPAPRVSAQRRVASSKRRSVTN